MADFPEADERRLSQVAAKLAEDLSWYDSRLVERLDLPNRSPRPAAEKALISIVRILARARLLAQGVSLEVQSRNPIAAMLCVRAHYETTGSLIYLLRHVKGFYEGPKTEKEMREAVDRVGIGSKRNLHGLYVEPLQVLTAIDHVDKFLKRRVSAQGSQFREMYNGLSEFCHPNAYGMQAVGMPTNDLQEFVINREPSLQAQHLGVIENHFLLSSLAFRMAFDELWELLRSKNPNLPMAALDRE